MCTVPHGAREAQVRTRDVRRDRLGYQDQRHRRRLDFLATAVVTADLELLEMRAFESTGSRMSHDAISLAGSATARSPRFTASAQLDSIDSWRLDDGALDVVPFGDEHLDAPRVDEIVDDRRGSDRVSRLRWSRPDQGTLRAAERSVQIDGLDRALRRGIVTADRFDGVADEFEGDTGAVSPAGKKSTTPPRTQNSPCSSTGSSRE